MHRRFFLAGGGVSIVGLPALGQSSSQDDTTQSVDTFTEEQIDLLTPTYGVVSTTVEFESIPSFASKKVPDKAPASAMLSTPAAASQTFGSCGAWATATVLEYSGLQNGGNGSFKRRFDAQEFYDEVRAKLKDCNFQGGFAIPTYMDLATLDGVPMLGAAANACGGVPAAGRTRAKSTGRVFHFKVSAPKEFNDIERVVAGGFPVAVSINSTKRFKSAFWTKRIHDYEVDPKELGPTRSNLHAVTIIGYDGEWMTVVNSWGGFWGNGGAALVSKSLMRKIILDAYTMV